MQTYPSDDTMLAFAKQRRRLHKADETSRLIAISASVTTLAFLSAQGVRFLVQHYHDQIVLAVEFFNSLWSSL